MRSTRCDLALPFPVDAERLDAVYQKGILRITARAPEQSKAKVVVRRGTPPSPAPARFRPVFRHPPQEIPNMSQTTDTPVNAAAANPSPAVAPERPDRARPVAHVRPRVDMFETDTGYVLRAELPGADESSVEVRVERDILTISAEVDLPQPEGFKAVYGTAGRQHYERAFKLADNVNPQGIDATVKNGLLSLTLPKVQPAVVKVAVKRAE